MKLILEYHVCLSKLSSPNEILYIASTIFNKKVLCAIVIPLAVYYFIPHLLCFMHFPIINNLLVACFKSLTYIVHVSGKKELT